MYIFNNILLSFSYNEKRFRQKEVAKKKQFYFQ